MKYVRENINERFAETSDPIEDMGIGMISFIRKAVEAIKNDELPYLRTNVIRDIGLTPSGDLICHTSISIPSYAPYIKDLFQKHGLAEYIIFNKRKTQSDAGYWFTLKIKPEYKEFFKEALGEKRMNEKFSEKSDPITDMGIGTPMIELFEKCNEYAKRAKERGTFEEVTDIEWKNEISTDKFMPGVIGKFYIKSNITTLVAIKVKQDMKNPKYYGSIYAKKWQDEKEEFRVYLISDWKTNETYIHVLRTNDHKSYFPKTFTGFISFTKAHKGDTGLRESLVTEKFNEKSDPIEDMGIGKIDFKDEFIRQYKNPERKLYKKWEEFMNQFKGKWIEGNFERYGALNKISYHGERVKAKVKFTKITMNNEGVLNLEVEGGITYCILKGESYKIKDK